MAFLDNLPYTTFKTDTDEILVRDVIRSITVNPFDLTDLLLDYEMQDDERIEDIAYNLYGSSEYHWVLMFINGKTDHLNDFPVRYETLMKAAVDNFGSVDGIHHLEGTDGKIVDFMTFPSYPVTNIEYMVNQNDTKRNIKVLRKEYLSEFVKSYNSAQGS